MRWHRSVCDDDALAEHRHSIWVGVFDPWPVVRVLFGQKDLNYISVIPIVFLSSLRFYYAC